MTPFEELRSTANHFSERRKRASERLSANPLRHWNFAFLGLSTEITNFKEEGVGEFRRVIEPPGEIELAKTLKEQTLFGAVGRYSHSITHELAITMRFEGDEQGAFNLGWWIVSALRVKTGAEFLVPLVADYSWSVIAGLDDQKCIVQLLEDIPQMRRLAEPVSISQSDLAWAFKKTYALGILLEKPNFRLAVEALTTHQHLLSQRMMAASLWAGLEGMLGIQSELRFRIAISLAAFLEERGPKRIERYRNIKKLYDFRSRAVHGSALTEKEITAHILEVRTLLAAVIQKQIESGHTLSEESIEQCLLE